MKLLPHNSFVRRSLFVMGAGLCTLHTPLASAISYGIFDARALAMGGTVIAVGNTSQAAYYNPALLAFHEGDEDKTGDGRVYLPTIVVQASNSVDSAISAADDNLDTEVANAVNAFNLNTTTENAGLVANSSRNLRNALNGIANKDLNLDAFVGLSVSEPGDHEGGAFYFGVRAVGTGTSSVSATDLALLDEYISAMDQLAGGASVTTVAADHPTLFDANGQLLDQTGALNSSADVGALAISEWGLALAKEFTFWGQAVSFGVTPKMMRIDAYRDDATTINNTTTTTGQFSDIESTHMGFNADFGIAAIIAEHYRVSFAIKDAFAKDFKTHQDPDPVTGIIGPDLVIKLNPRSRMGVGYVNNSFSFGIDYDLEASTPMLNEAPSQDVSLGAEYQVFNSLALRVGYRQDQTGLRSNVMSGGIGFHWHRFVADLAYAQNSDMKGGSLQLGWTF